jgi:hypothetical protein
MSECLMMTISSQRDSRVGYRKVPRRVRARIIIVVVVVVVVVVRARVDFTRTGTKRNFNDLQLFSVLN